MKTSFSPKKKKEKIVAFSLRTNNPFSIRPIYMFCARDKRPGNTFPTRRSHRRGGIQTAANTNRKFVDNDFSTAGNVSRFLSRLRLFPATTGKIEETHRRLSTATDTKRNARHVSSNSRASPLDNNNTDDETSYTNICSDVRGLFHVLSLTKRKRRKEES